MDRRLILFLGCYLAFTSGIAEAQTVERTPPGSQIPLEPQSQSVSARLEWLKAQPGLRTITTKPDGWSIVSTADGAVQWSFTATGHYAHAAVVRREIKQRPNGDVFVEMTSQCEAPKDACDKLLGEFAQLNERMAAEVQRRLRGR
jgi:hypothetical protein